MKKIVVKIDAHEAKTIRASLESLCMEEEDLYCVDQDGNEIEDEEEIWGKGAHLVLESLNWGVEVVDEEEFDIIKTASDFALEVLGEEQFNSAEHKTAKYCIMHDFIQGWNFAIDHFKVDHPRYDKDVAELSEAE